MLDSAARMGGKKSHGSNLSLFVDTLDFETQLGDVSINYCISQITRGKNPKPSSWLQKLQILPTATPDFHEIQTINAGAVFKKNPREV